MTSYKGSIKALAIIIVLLSIIVVSKLDNKQIKTETSTYYETRLYTVTSAPPAETVTEVVPTVQTDLKGLNQYKSAFISAGQKFGIDYKLLISIAILESGWGTSKHAVENNNIFGWNSGVTKFKSVEHCIYYVAEFLSREYLSPDGMYFEGYGIDSIAKHYNENPQKWAGEIKKIYGGLK